MTTTTPKTPIDFEDIQGLVRFAHGRLPESAFLLLTIKQPAAARQWLAEASITSASPVTPLPETALQVAFTATGLRILGIDEAIISEFSDEFTSGMSADSNRCRRLGDTGSNDPQHWQWGASVDNSPHLLLLVYSAKGKLTRYLQQLKRDSFGTAFDITYTLTAKTAGGEEPFGFADGISQPLVDWQQTISTDPHQRDAYVNLLALGEVLLGYPNEYGLYTARPLLNPAAATYTQALPAAADQPHMKDLGRNGTYLVLRQLQQDVTGFWQFIDQQAGGDVREREQLAAAMVGRHRDGKPLVTRSSTSITGVDPQNADDQFTFDADPQGRQCPIGAHIRRANPRTGDFPAGVNGMLGRLVRTLGFGRRYPTEDLIASSRFHRILRRGRVYGSRLTPEQALRARPLKKADEERGLYFVCLGANISRQFEFVQSAWSMSSKFAGLPTQSDPLLGNREPLANGAATGDFSLPQQDAPARVITDLPQFVTVRGGGYFFMPGLRALHYLLHANTD